MKTKKRRVVFLAYTLVPMLDGHQPELLKVYGKSSYQDAYNWLAEIAERHGNAVHPQGLWLPCAGIGNVALWTVNPKNGQRWWIERHEVF